MKISPLFLCALLACGGPAALRAQEEQLILDPPLGQAFPLDAMADGIHVPYPVLLNDHMVLGPQAVLRFIYIDPNAGSRTRGGGDGGNGFRTHVGPGGRLDQDGRSDIHSENGWGHNDTSDAVGIFDDSKKDDAKQSKAEMQGEVWRQKDLFVEALDHAAAAGTTLVYNLPAEKKPLTAAIDLPEGMLLAQVEGHVRVLALSQDSRAFAGGIRPGDEIRAFGDGAALASLEDFMRAYAATKHQAKVSGNPTYALSIWRPDEKQLVTIQIAAPPTIPKLF